MDAAGPLSALRQLRVVAFAEGLSFLALLFVAMPLKYLAGQPPAVSVVGSLHGLLFLIFLAALYRAAAERAWRLPQILIAVTSAILPFGVLVLDRSLRREIDRVSNAAAISRGPRARI
jgi:integral membrane protein